LTIHLHREFSQVKNGAGVDVVQNAEIAELPSVSNDVLDSLFDRLSARDKVDVLQAKIIPVAFFPHKIFYAAAGDAARTVAAAEGKCVVASMEAGQLALAIKRKLGPELLQAATYAMFKNNPKQSSFHRIRPAQAFWLCVVVTLLGVAFQSLGHDTFYALISAVFGLFFLAVVALRVLCLFEPAVAKAAYTQIAEEDLPVYTVLVPVFRETQVLGQLLTALKRLKYPAEKLDIKLILEESDIAMQRAVASHILPDCFDVIVVPAGSPQTKPRALNYALQFARGRLLTIYDAEDVPEPLQLIKSAAQFAAGSDGLACLQAELAFYNPNENWLTRQFAIEYATLFKLMLPAFVAEKLPLPLGGTSNHFRIDILRQVGAWDPFNVTEDADLGLRLARLGYSTAMLDSITYEEATAHRKNWLHQRSRWLKGFMQTWLVHSREPLKMRRELGTYGAAAAHAVTLGVVLSALFHPFFLLHAVFVLASLHFYELTPSPYMTSLMGINFVVFAVGYACAIYAGYKALRHKKIAGWGLALVTMPFYWLLISLAGWIALWQFITKPHHWNKTEHGRSQFQKR
jgi:glycosyltransferase XagB